MLWHIQSASAQTGWFKPDTAIAMTKAGKNILNPWSGGLNATQFCKMDLNFDGTEDLVVFDRTNSKISTFIATSQKTFVHAPSYELKFPAMDNWMILADYNKDGLKDLFASTALGITVYKQVRVGNSFGFVLQRDALYTMGFSAPINLQVGGTDIPAITDLDDDGDLDVLTFDFSGTFIELHQNLSMERFGVPDSLGTAKSPVYARNGECWGNFNKGANNDFIFGGDCGVVDMDGAKIMHAGNSILLHDVNGDGNKDLLVGHVSNDHISVLYNTAPGIVANFTSFTHNYPSSEPIQFQIFPAVFMEDIDFDGVKDLIASPNVSSNEGNLMDFQSSNWYYHNSGTDNNPVFELRQKDFLQAQMLDVGENAAPSFFDIDADGDLDMIVGTGGVAGNGDFKGRLVLLRNTGTADNPVFNLESDNYLDIPASLSIYNIKPQWADFNGDGVTDLGFAGISSRNLKLEYRYIPNRAKSGPAQLNVNEAVIIPMPIEAEIGDSPFFYDTDRDGDLDMIVGKPQGNIMYYKNTGSPSKYTFALETDQFAGVSASYEGRFVHPVLKDMDLDGKLDLLTVDHSGRIRIFYDGEFGAWTKRESLLVQNDGKGTAPYLGNYLYASVADYNHDNKPDIAVGTNAGGVRIFGNILPVVVTGVEPSTFEVKTYPNPADEIVTVFSTENALLNIINLNGRTIRRNVDIRKNEENRVDTNNLPTGLYLFEIRYNEEKIVKKVLIK